MMYALSRTRSMQQGREDSGWITKNAIATDDACIEERQCVSLQSRNLGITDLDSELLSAGLDLWTGGDEVADGGEAPSSAPSPESPRPASALGE